MNEQDPLRDLELQKIRLELQVRETELRLKDLELQSSRNKSRWGATLSAAQATVIVAAIGFTGSFLATYFQGWNAQELKQVEFESNLVIRAVETGNVEVSKKNLEFLLAAGFIRDDTGRIAKLVASPDYSIQLPARMSEPLRKAVESADYEAVVREIIAVVGIPLNSRIQLNERIASAAAVQEYDQRLILLNPRWVAGLRTSTGTDWASVFVLAHEMAHHFLGHTGADRSQPGKAKQLELEADQFAANVVKRLGGSLEDVRRSLVITDEVETEYTPSRSQRIAAAEKGWNQSVATPERK